MMMLRLLCPALLVAVLFCDATLATEEQECSIFEKTKIGGCSENKGGFAADKTYIGKPGADGCNEVCRDKGYIGGCCTLSDDECWCALAKNTATPAEAPKAA